MKINRRTSSGKRRFMIEALHFVRILAGYECTGAPACEPPSVDVATGKREGGLCATCEAREWLRENVSR